MQLFLAKEYRPEFFTDLDVSGNTPLREAILEVRDWLDPIAARQKVAMVFTDAEPTSSTPAALFAGKFKGYCITTPIRVHAEAVYVRKGRS